jgi:hypothetical protein
MFRPEVPMSDEHNDQYNDDYDDEYDDDDDQAGLPWPPPAQPPYPEPPGRSRTSKIVLLMLTAAVAAAAGFFVVTAVRDVSATPATASATPGATPTSPAQGGLPTAGSGNGNGALPIPSTGPGETLHLEIGGRVSAVSPTSITLGAQGQSVTAAVTRSTAITGKVRAISRIKVGDLVSAQITSTGGKLTATAIQDPASIP